MLNPLPQVIKPAISPSLLGKARRFFNNSPVEILSELLQNSRRAGATQVQINHYPVADGIFVSVKDNGSGIANPSDLLTLGGSGWEKAVQDREDPAGCGFFSLVALGGIVRSHNWRVEIKPESFDELGGATVKEEAEVLSGTEVSLVFPKADAHTVQTAVIDNVRYYPVPTLVKGQPAEQSGFLEHALSRVARHGVQIGVMVQQHRFRNVNFHGHSFCHNAFPTLVCGKTTYTVAWDVENASELQLVLPARRDFVQNGFYEEMLRESEIGLPGGSVSWSRGNRLVCHQRNRSYPPRRTVDGRLLLAERLFRGSRQLRYAA